MSPEPTPPSPDAPPGYRRARTPGEDQPPGMTFWTRFYVGAMAGTVACVIGSVASFNRAWIAAVIVAVLSVPLIILSRRAHSSGYVAGYWTIALAMTATFLIVSPYLHS